MATRKAADTATPDTMTDPVDWAHHYWQEHGLQGDEQRFLAMSSLLRYQRLVVDAVEEALRAHKLNLTDYLVLMTLQLSENGTRLISNLARSLMVHATTATLATDRLQKRRLISRTPTPHRPTGHVHHDHGHRTQAGTQGDDHTERDRLRHGRREAGGR
ncbi:MarR family transcriptional regulator [Prauserella oleivorans]|uniref:MarR family transcriptional regulator n=1 Tax=Prauserella oleivorans TaxID=1478153 RepID=UPI00362B157E